MRFISREQNLKIYSEPKLGFNVQFVNGMFDTDDDKVMDFIRNLGGFNSTIFEEVAPDDVVRTMMEVIKYVCGFPKCTYSTTDKGEMQEHKQDEHSKEARARKRQAELDAQDEADAAAEAAVEKKSKKKKKGQEE